MLGLEKGSIGGSDWQRNRHKRIIHNLEDLKMSISGISMGYYPTGYANVNTVKNTTDVSFTETISEKAATDKIDYDERAFEYLAPNAPEEVKKAWMEAAKETGANGMGMGKDGKLTHITAMMSIQLTNRLKGCYSSGGRSDLSGGDLLGSTVESALSVAKQALYDREHALEPLSRRSWEVQKHIEKEMAFYRAFIDKLERL